MRQAVSRLEDAGYVHYDDGPTVADERVRDAAREFVAASAAVNLPSIEEAYIHDPTVRRLAIRIRTGRRRLRVDTGRTVNSRRASSRRS